MSVIPKHMWSWLDGRFPIQHYFLDFKLVSCTVSKIVNILWNIKVFYLVNQMKWNAKSNFTSFEKLLNEKLQLHCSNQKCSNHTGKLKGASKSYEVNITTAERGRTATKKAACATFLEGRRSRTLARKYTLCRYMIQCKEEVAGRSLLYSQTMILERRKLET